MPAILRTLAVAATLVAPLAHAQTAPDPFARSGPSPEGAVALSAVATAVPVAIGTAMMVGDVTPANGALLALAGVVWGPTAGYAYAGTRVPRTGPALRAGGSLLIIGGVATYGFADWCLFCTAEQQAEIEEHDSERRVLGAAAMAVGSALIVGSTVYDLVGAGQAASEKRARLQVGPGYDAATGTPTVAVHVGL